MPRSVYVVKGEGVRDSVWTPKTALSAASLAHSPELVQTVPSPNCSVNPVVQVFVQPPISAGRLAQTTAALCIPNNAITTPLVAPGVPSTSPNPHVAPTLARRQVNPPNTHPTQQPASSTNAQAASHVPGGLASSPNQPPALNPQNLAGSRQTGRAATSTRPPFPAYNRSPMVCTVLEKQRSIRIAATPASSVPTKSTTPTPAQNRPLDGSLGHQQVHRNANAHNGPTSSTLRPPVLTMRSAPTGAQKDRPKSPTSPVKPPHTTKKLSAADEAYAREKRRVLGNIVERRIAHHREKLAEKSRPLTPISKLIEVAAQSKSSAKKNLDSEIGVLSDRVENAHIEAPVVANMETTQDVARPSTSADDIKRPSSREDGFANTNTVPTVAPSVELIPQRHQVDIRELRAAEDQYLTLLRSLFALASQAQQDGRRRDGLSGTELKLYMKKRVLAAFATHTRERASVLSKKALKLLTQFKLCGSDAARLARLTNTDARGALLPVRRSKKSEVRREDISGLKPMLLSWERLRSGEKVNTDQFHTDVIHLKCIAEALEDSTQISISNGEAYALFRELVLVNTGIELIYDTISELKTVYKSGNHECVRPWLRSTDGILKWHDYMRSRMVNLLTVAEEPLSSELRTYCKTFVKLGTDPPDDQKSKYKMTEGIKMARKLRELKKLIKSLGQDEQGNDLPIEDEFCVKTTALLTTATKSFARLVRQMTTLSATPKRTAEGNGDGSGGSSREGSPESKTRRGDDGGRQKRQADSRAKFDEIKRCLDKDSEARSGLKKVATNQEKVRDRAMKDARATGDIRKRGVIDERRTVDRGRGSEGDEAKADRSLRSIPRRPAREDNGAASARANGARSNGGGVVVGERWRKKSGPAATVQRMLANAAAPAGEKSKKRKRERGEGILQSHEKEALDEQGMRADRQKRKRIRFDEQRDVSGNEPAADKESLRTLFSDGESWMLSGNAVQKEAIEERNGRLSREAVDTWFGFLRVFVWQHKCMKEGRTFVRPRYLPNPTTPSAIRELSRRVVPAPLQPPPR